MELRESVSLKELTTLQTGGTARYFAVAGSAAELREAVAIAKEKDLPFFILGGGSNLLVSQGIIDAVVVQNSIRGVEWRDEEASVLAVSGAGENWDALVAESVRRGLWGLENLSGIPGTVGAAPVQNIGAYGAELAELLAWVEGFDALSGETKTLSLEACRLSYRESFFKTAAGKNFIITRVALRLKKDGAPNLSYKDLQQYFSAKPTPTLAEIRTAVLEVRSKKFPDLTQFGTAGSFFKNPIVSTEAFAALKKRFPDLPGFQLPRLPTRLPIGGQVGGQATTNYQVPSFKIPLAWILEHLCNLKGLRKGSVGLFPNQPIVLVNYGGATAEEIRAFAEEIERIVREKTGITIEREVVLV